MITNNLVKISLGYIFPLEENKLSIENGSELFNNIQKPLEYLKNIDNEFSDIDNEFSLEKINGQLIFPLEKKYGDKYEEHLLMGISDYKYPTIAKITLSANRAKFGLNLEKSQKNLGNLTLKILKNCGFPDLFIKDSITGFILEKIYLDIKILGKEIDKENFIVYNQGECKNLLVKY